MSTRVRNYIQMAKFESISPIKIGLNATEYENNITQSTSPAGLWLGWVLTTAENYEPPGNLYVET